MSNDVMITVIFKNNNTCASKTFLIFNASDFLIDFISK